MVDTPEQFRFTITAVDGWSKQFASLEKQIGWLERQKTLAGSGVFGAASRFGAAVKLGRVGGALAEAGGDASGIFADAEKLSSIGATLGRFITTAKLPQLAHAAEDVGSKFEGVVSRVHALLGPVAALGALAGGLFEIGKSAAEVGAGLYDASQKTGVAVDQLARLHYIAGVTNVGTDQLDMGLTRLNRTIGEVASGRAAEAAGYLRKMHINIRDGGGHLKNAGALWGELSERFKNNKSDAEKTAAALALLGRSGAALLPMLIKGADETQRLGDEFDRLHGRVTGEGAAAAKEASESWHRLTVTFGGLRDAIGAKLFPMMEKIIEPMTQWLVTNRQIVATKVAEWVKRVSDTLSNVDWGGLAGSIGKIAGAFETVANFLGTKGMIIAGSAVLFAPLSVAILALAASFTTLTAAMLTNPFVAAVAVLAAGAVLVVTHWSQVKAFFAGIGEYIAGVLTRISEHIQPLIDDVKWLLGKTGVSWLYDSVADIGAHNRAAATHATVAPKAKAAMDTLGGAVATGHQAFDAMAARNRGATRYAGRPDARAMASMRSIALAIGATAATPAAAAPPLAELHTIVAAAPAGTADKAGLPATMAAMAETMKNSRGSSGAAMAEAPRPSLVQASTGAGLASRQQILGSRPGTAVQPPTNGKVEVEVTVNAPRGTTVVAKASGSNPPDLNVGRRF